MARIVAPANATTAQGSQIQRSSERRTRRPQLEKKGATPMGDTTRTRHGKKHRRFENGLKKATPRPPVVIASRTPCDAVARKTIANAASGLACRGRQRKAAAAPTSRAKTIE